MIVEKIRDSKKDFMSIIEERNMMKLNIRGLMITWDIQHKLMNIASIMNLLTIKNLHRMSISRIIKEIPMNADLITKIMNL